MRLSLNYFFWNVKEEQDGRANSFFSFRFDSDN
jgi:hypothetical protein